MDFEPKRSKPIVIWGGFKKRMSEWKSTRAREMCALRMVSLGQDECNGKDISGSLEETQRCGLEVEGRRKVRWQVVAKEISLITLLRRG